VVLDREAAGADFRAFKIALGEPCHRERIVLDTLNGGRAEGKPLRRFRFFDG